jgi:NDP-sugar pyrophosphorylase family protein
MKAMILAAGLGTRLKPLTDNKPKALIEVKGVPLLEHVMLKLLHFGYDEFLINLHPFPDQIIAFVKNKDFFGSLVEFSYERGEPLDTGGGLLKGGWFFNDLKPFLVHNVDVLSDVDLAALRNAHTDSNSLVTLAVRKRETSRYFLFNDHNHLCGWMNKETGEKRIERTELSDLTPLAFSGIQMIDPTIFSLITEEGKFSLTELYLRLCRENVIKGFIHNDGFWSDVGKPDQLANAQTFQTAGTSEHTAK